MIYIFFLKNIINILYIITPENIQNTLKILMAINIIKSSNQNVIKERNEFNGYIMNFLINIINLNDKNFNKGSFNSISI